MVKSSGRQQTASASAAPGVKSSRSNSSTDDSDRESAVHQSAAADSQLISSGSSSRSQRDTTAGSRADTGGRDRTGQGYLYPKLMKILSGFHKVTSGLKDQFNEFCSLISIANNIPVISLPHEPMRN